MFALIVPRRPPVVDWVIDGDRWVTEVVKPAEVAELCISMNTGLPDQHAGVAVYFAFPPFDSWEFLGALTNNCPSNIFSTGWALHPEAARFDSVRVLLHLESESTILTKLQTNPPQDVKKVFAQKVALNLFRFIESYSQQGGEALRTNPQAVLDRWLVRFEEKYKLDPNFVLKTE